jgi:hypothetical protein
MGIQIQWKKPIQQLINQNILGKETMEFAAKTAEEIMLDFVPMNTGDLSDDPGAIQHKHDVNIIAGETIAAVHYTAPYAAEVYYDNKKVFKPFFHSNATAFWDKHAMAAGGKDRLVAAVKDHIKNKKG